MAISMFELFLRDCCKVSCLDRVKCHNAQHDNFHWLISYEVDLSKIVSTGDLIILRHRLDLEAYLTLDNEGVLLQIQCYAFTEGKYAEIRDKWEADQFEPSISVSNQRFPLLLERIHTLLVKELPKIPLRPLFTGHSP